MTRKADVCLILEGSYPFVSGGVSSWVHRLVTGLPDISFNAVCILPSAKEPHKMKYTLPDNFAEPEILYIHDVMKTSKNPFKRLNKKGMQEIREFHEGVKGMRHPEFQRIVEAFQDDKYPLWDLMHGKLSWEYLIELVERNTPDAPFMDYFWTFRFTHLPIFKALGTKLPEAHVYHSVSTGYAGLLGAVARILTGRPLLLTEHGIYTKERKIEIAQSEALMDKQDRLRIQKELGTYQQFWVNIFATLGRITYRYAERIVTLYEGNRQMQLKDGADPWKTDIIPNGIDLDSFQKLKPQSYPEPEQGSFVVGFVGRVVPIKDVKTFIRACKNVSLSMPDTQFWIMGPTEEDEEYYEECVDLVKVLQLENTVTFLGQVNVMDYYPQIDLVVLTSISEAQPLVIMEANCAGIPVVASDVGSCRELLEGRLPDDRRLGASGITTTVADPEETADAIKTILGDYDVRRKMSLAGRRRIERFYSEAVLNERYRNLYRELIGLPAFSGPGGMNAEETDDDYLSEYVVGRESISQAGSISPAVDNLQAADSNKTPRDNNGEGPWQA